MFNPTYIGVLFLGFLHGFEPGHGWPVAVLYSVNRKNALVSATISSTVIGVGHLISSIAVVIAYLLLQKWLNFESSWIKYLSAGLLLLLAIKLFIEKVDDVDKQHGHLHPGIPETEHEHAHEHAGAGLHTHKHKHKAAIALSLFSIASFAFILGFAHEEEIALLALVAGGLNAWVLMLTYGVAVLSGLILVTIIGVKVYRRFQQKLARYEKHIPKPGAGLLLLMAIFIIFW